MDLNELIKKDEILNGAKNGLKKQFFGIDKVINQLVGSLRSWYHLPEFQNRPLVINLWGGAGVGKSQLVKEMIKLLGLDQLFFEMEDTYLGRQDLIEKTSFLATIESPVRAIFLIDNFQFYINQNDTKLNEGRPENDFLWKVLDDGKIRGIGTSRREFDIIQDLSKGFSQMIKSGLKVENGFVAEECIKYFRSNQTIWGLKRKSFPKDWIDSTKEESFVLNYSEAKILFETGKHEFKEFKDFVEKIKTLDEKEVLHLINSILKRSLHADLLDFSRSVFIVVGNLEEVIKSPTDPDLSVSKEGLIEANSLLSPSKIEAALSEFLPLELVARLGNNHIIFPILNSQDFRQIIRKELFSIRLKFLRETGVPLVFDESVENWLLAEGAFPDLGVRPLLSSIQYGIVDLIPQVIFGLYHFRKRAEKVVVSIAKGMDVHYLKGDKAILK